MLTFHFKRELRDFTLEITQEVSNETLVLIGHSGCGKSTTLKLLSGLMSADEGSIMFNDSVVYDKQRNIDLPPEERNIGFVFQNYALFPHLTVLENIAYGISNISEGEREQRIKETIAFLGIESLVHSKPRMLSGGEQQRVALARALVTRPKVLLLDEPLSALDISTRSHVRAELKELLKKLSIPTIVVTHDYEDARVLGDKVAVMDRGKVIQYGTPYEIMKYPANHFVAEFTGTNLVPVKAKDAYVAFDPWKVDVTRESHSNEYEWYGEIRDLSTLGGFVRLHVVGEALAFYADISMERNEKEQFQIGESVYATVGESDVRQISSEHTPSMSRDIEQKGSDVTVLEDTQLFRKKKHTLKWVLSFGFVLFLLLSTTMYNSYSSEPASELIEVNMFGLIAANATDPFNDIAEVFEDNHLGVDVEATFAGTQIVRTQLEQGAEADLFLSADLGHIQAVKDQGLIDEFYPVSLNRVVVVVPKDDRIGIHSLEDIGLKKVKLVIGTDTVPIGRYTRDIFEKGNGVFGADFSERAMANVVSLETNVKQVLQKVSLGEAEAGLVYLTDVTPEFLEKVKVVDIPKELNVVATNYISVPNEAPNKELAEEFMDFMLSKEGQEIFMKYKYTPVNEGLE